MPRIRVLTSLASIVLLPTVLQAQHRPPIFKSEIEVVKVTAVVTDKAERRIKHLSRDDFVVREDGRAQDIRVFARASDPSEEEALTIDLALLFDTSQSMSSVLKDAQLGAARFLHAVPRARSLWVVFFEGVISLSRYESQMQQSLFDRIYSSTSGGNTHLYEAVAAALSRIQDGTGRQVVVLFTDGEDVGSNISRQEVIALVRSSPVTVYPISFSGATRSASTALSFLRDLARTTGGRVFQPSRSQQFSKIYEDILEDLASQYVLGYVSDRSQTDGRFRKIKVEIMRKDLKVRHRIGYQAPGRNARRRR
ncbi:MAG: VWA domain-containing protein [Vicinamibacteria bacterium]|nr:VWA domain-containing protein [Vicinamibacteria bacterium]